MAEHCFHKDRMRVFQGYLQGETSNTDHDGSERRGRIQSADSAEQLKDGGVRSSTPGEGDAERAAGNASPSGASANPRSPNPEPISRAGTPCAALEAQASDFNAAASNREDSKEASSSDEDETLSASEVVDRNCGEMDQQPEESEVQESTSGAHETPSERKQASEEATRRDDQQDQTESNKDTDDKDELTEEPGPGLINPPAKINTREDTEEQSASEAGNLERSGSAQDGSQSSSKGSALIEEAGCESNQRAPSQTSSSHRGQGLAEGSDHRGADLRVKPPEDILETGSVAGDNEEDIASTSSLAFDGEEGVSTTSAGDVSESDSLAASNHSCHPCLLPIQ